MWVGLFLIGAMAAFLMAWVGFGLTLAAMAVYQWARCPARVAVEGGYRTCEDGSDVRALFVVAVVGGTPGSHRGLSPVVQGQPPRRRWAFQLGPP